MHTYLPSFEINELAWSANSDHVLMATGGTGGGSGSVGGNLDILEFKNDKLSYVDSICAHTSNCMFLKVNFVDDYYNPCDMNRVTHFRRIY